MFRRPIALVWCAVLLGAPLSCEVNAQDSWSRYRVVTIDDFIANEESSYQHREPNSNYYYLPSDGAVKFEAVYIEDIRRISLETLGMLQMWGRSLDIPESTIEIYTQEVRLLTDGVARWYPIQESLAEDLQDLPFPFKIEVYARFTGSYERDEGLIWVIAITRFIEIGFLGESNPPWALEREQGLFLLAYIHIQFDKYDEAQSYLDTLLTVNPSHAQAHALNGFVQYADGEVSDAMASFDTAISIDPDDGFIYEQRALVFGYMRDYRGALRNWNQAIERDQERSDYFLKRGFINLQVGDFRSAEEDGDASIQYSDGDCGECFLLRGSARISYGLIDSGCHDISLSCEMGEEQSCDLYQSLRSCN